MQQQQQLLQQQLFEQQQFAAAAQPAWRATAVPGGMMLPVLPPASSLSAQQQHLQQQELQQNRSGTPQLPRSSSSASVSAAAAAVAAASAAFRPSTGSAWSVGPLAAASADVEGETAATGDGFDARMDDRDIGPAMARLLQSAPRLVEGSLVPQVRETSVLDGITLPVVPAIAGWVGAYPYEARTRRLALYQEKRMRRVWEKTVKYDVRKSFADSRLRVKGRFVKKEDEALLRDFCQLL